jgi:hypothetical protein
MIARRVVTKGLLPALTVGGVLAASLLAGPLNLAGIGVAACSYGYLGAPTVTGISPTQGSTGGGQVVAITGCGFTGATGVTFGGTAATGVVVNNDSSVTATSPAHAAGVADVVVTTAAGSSAATAADHFTYATVCNSVTISPASATVAHGSNVHDLITAVGSGCPNSALYEFWFRTASTNWVLIQGFSATATFNWNTAGAPVTTVYFGVWLKDLNSTTATFDANAFTTVNVTPAVCTTAGISAASPSVNHGSGATDLITATSSGCTNSAVYEFWFRSSTTNWVMIQAFSATATFNWNSAGAPVTTVYFGIWVKDTGSSTSTFDANASTSVAVNPSTCTGASTLTAATPTVTGGAHDILTATSSGCTNSAVYEFWMVQNGTWVMVQSFSATATFDWNSTGAPKGTYTFGVWVKDVGSTTSTFDKNASTTVMVV